MSTVTCPCGLVREAPITASCPACSVDGNRGFPEVPVVWRTGSVTSIEGV